MATAGPNQASAAAEFDDFLAPWTNASAAVTDDNSYATATLDSAEASDTNFLDWTGFGFSLPAGADVSDVTVEVAAKVSGGSAEILNTQLIVGGSVAGDQSGTTSGSIGSSEAYASASGSVSLNYATTLSAAQANASDFGVRVQFRQLTGAGTLSVDACRVTLTYTVAASGRLCRAASLAGLGGAGQKCFNPGLDGV